MLSGHAGLLVFDVRKSECSGCLLAGDDLELVKLIGNDIDGIVGLIPDFDFAGGAACIEADHDTSCAFGVKIATFFFVD